MRRIAAIVLISTGIVALALQVAGSKIGFRQAVDANADRILELAVEKILSLDETNPLVELITPDQPWFSAYAKSRFVAIISSKVDPAGYLARLKEKLEENAVEDASFDELVARAKEIDARVDGFSMPRANITITKAHRKRLRKWAKGLREFNLLPDDPRWLDSMAELATELPDVRAKAGELKRLVIEHKRERAELELLLLEALDRARELMNTPDELWDWDRITGDPESVFELIEPKMPFYRESLELYRRYRQLAGVEFEKIAVKGRLKKGRSYPVVADIKRRLALDGFFHGEPTEVFDDEFESAVKEFQKYHGLNPDGVIGKRTLAALNMPFDAKLDKIRLNLARMRSSAVRLYPRVLWINIPSYRLWLVEDGRVRFSSKVIVGNRHWAVWAPPWLKEIPPAARPKPVVGPWNQTPTISSAIDKIVVNPRWGTSERILDELLAKEERKDDPEDAQRDLLRFDRANYIWGLHPSGRVYLYQDPSVANLLGKVKFSFPNEHSIFLHDTPSKYLFKRWPRAFSHGCIRIEKPLELAKLILEMDKNDALERWGELLEDSSKPHIIELNSPLPIVIDYITIGPTDWSGDGVAFLDDIYTLDPPESERLKEKRDRFQAYLKRLEQIRKGEIWPRRD